MTDHCPACRVRRELTEHRDQTAAEWSQRRAALNFARIVAGRACPDYAPHPHPEPTDEQAAVAAEGEMA